MSQMFFGQYLLDEQVIGEDALGEAIDHAERVNARVGALAVERGFMSEAEIGQVQFEQRQTDLRFADLAIELGLLSREQALELLREQKKRHKPIGEALVELGHLARHELDDWLDRFHLTQLDLDAAHLELPLELCEEDLAVHLVEYLPKLFRRITQVPLKLQGGRAWHGRSNLPHRVCVSIEGDVPIQIGIAACPELGALLAAGLATEPSPSFGDIELTGAVCEFAEIFAQAGEQSVVHDGLSAQAGSAEPNALPKAGFWFPATTPCGRGVLVLEPR